MYPSPRRRYVRPQDYDNRGSDRSEIARAIPFLSKSSRPSHGRTHNRCGTRPTIGQNRIRNILHCEQFMYVNIPLPHILVVDVNDICMNDFQPALLQDPTLIRYVPQVNIANICARFDLIDFVPAFCFMQDINGAIAPVFGKRRLANILFPLGNIFLRIFELGGNIKFAIGGIRCGLHEITKQAHG